MEAVNAIGRHLEPQVEAALRAARVVMLHGARQAGKSTLAGRVAAAAGGVSVTLDDEATLELVRADPVTFLSSGPHPLVIDEVQLAGDRLIRAVKRIVDADPVPGRFLLTGSTNFLTVPTISESLAGRVRILHLWPLSEAEIAGTAGPPIEAWLDGEPPSVRASLERGDYLEIVCRGGFPEVLPLAPADRHGWFKDYAATVVQRDIVALADIRRRTAIAPLLHWVAASTSGQINLTKAAGDLGINRATVVGYLEWLRTVFLIHELPAWSRNAAARAIRAPKVYLTDSGLAADLLGADSAALRSPASPMLGKLWETFIVGEVARQIASSTARADLFHYRTKNQREIDLIVQRPDGGIVAVEIKATVSPTSDDLRHAAWLRDRLDRSDPGSFLGGVLVHMGTQSGKVGDRLHLRPASALWTPS